MASAGVGLQYEQSIALHARRRIAVTAYICDTSLTREALGRAKWFLYDSSGANSDTLLQPFFGDPPVSLISRREGNVNSMGAPFLPRPPIIGLMTTLDGALLVSVSTASEPFEPDPPRVIAGEVWPPQLTFRSLTSYEWFGADGSLRGKLTLPRGARLHVMRGRAAWGTVIDSLDVPYLVRWRVDGASTAP